MNKAFLARFPGKVIPLAKVLPYASQLPQLPPIPWVDNDGSLASNYLAPCSDRTGVFLALWSRAGARYHPLPLSQQPPRSLSPSRPT
jgi:hypothetical protein